jgi:hypothetical protein
MNEFEWRRQMRELRQPLMPQRDIWASIDAALEDVEPSHAVANIAATPLRASHRWAIATGLAASLLIVGGIAWHLHQAPATVTLAGTSAPTKPSAKWKPADPRLAGAAIELDAARMELQQAIRQAPDSSGLQRILARTEQQQTQLRQLAREG